MIDESSREDLDVDVDALTKHKKELEGELIEIKKSKEGIDYDLRLSINGTIKYLENELKT